MPNTVNSYMVTDLGNVSPNPRGEYNATYDYEYLDLVYYKGGSYVCLAPLGETIANVAPIAGQTTTNWQCVAIPGNITPEYISMYNEVVKDYNETNTNTADVAQMKASTYVSMTAAQESESKASTSETNARNSEVSAKQSMDKAKEYSDEAIRVNNDTQSLVTGFDEHVTTAISNAEASISESTDNAKGEIVAQKSSSLNEFRTDAETVMTNEKNVAVAEIHQMVDSFSADADSKKQEVIQVADEKINDMTALKNDTVNAKNAAETAATTAVEKASEAATSAGEAKSSSDEAKANADLVAADKAIVAADKTEIGGMKSAVESSVAKFESDLETYNLPTMNNDINALKSDLDNKIISTANLFDKNKLVSGFYTTTKPTAQISENANFKCLLMDVKSGNQYTMSGYGYTTSFYDKNGNRDTVHKVGNGIESSDSITFIVPENAVKMSINLKLTTNNPDEFMVVEGDTLPSAYVPFENILYASPYIEMKELKELKDEVYGKEYHVGVGREYTSFTACLKALENDNTKKTICVHEGVYDIFDEIGGTAFLSTINDSDVWYDVSTIIPNNTKIIGIGEVILEYLPNASDIPSDNAVSCISPLNIRGNTEIENISIIAKNCRYCIHDEGSGLADFDECKRILRNVRCKKLANDYVPVVKVITGQAYASGYNKRNVAIFENCEFISESNTGWSCHNRWYNTYDGSTITFENCIFIGNESTGSIRFGNASTHVSHSDVRLSNCYLNGKLRINNESSTGTYYNTFDVTMLNCTNVQLDVVTNTDNEYPVKVYNPIPVIN